MAQKSYRLRFQFWLDITKDVEERIAARIETLKEERQFSRAIREGLALWLALRERDISLLLELHPWIADHFQQAQKKPRLGESDHNDQIKALQTKIDTLTELVLQKETSDQLDTVPQKQLSSGSNVENRDMLQLTGELLEIKSATSDAQNNSAYNFMIASAVQVYGNYDALPPEIVAYGVETGRIPADKVKNKTSKPKTANPKAMDVPEFEAPEFDDLDVQF